MQNRNFSTMHVRMEGARENLAIRHVGDAPRRWPVQYRKTYEGRKQGSYNTVTTDTDNLSFVSSKQRLKTYAPSSHFTQSTSLAKLDIFECTKCIS